MRGSVRRSGGARACERRVGILAARRRARVRAFAATLALAAGLGACSAGVRSTPPPSAFYQEAMWSPDGQTLLLSRYEEGGYKIYSIRADGTEMGRLTSGPGEYWATWSPEGDRFAFTCNRGGNDEICVANADGSGMTPLTRNPAKETTPAWAPDGSAIAFVSDREEGHYQLHIMDPDGSDQVRIGRGATAEYNPTWAPDSERLAFFASESDTDWVFVMRRDGTERRRIARGVFPSWSPDGGRILYDRSDSLFAANTDGSGERLMALDAFAGRWSPDGEKIAFIRGGWPASEVFIMSADGTGEFRLAR